MNVKKRSQILAVAVASVLLGVVIQPACADVFVSGNHSTILQFDNSGGFIGQFSSGGSLNAGRGVCSATGCLFSSESQL